MEVNANSGDELETRDGRLSTSGRVAAVESRGTRGASDSDENMAAEECASASNDRRIRDSGGNGTDVANIANDNWIPSTSDPDLTPDMRIMRLITDIDRVDDLRDLKSVIGQINTMLVNFRRELNASLRGDYRLEYGSTNDTSFGLEMMRLLELEITLRILRLKREDTRLTEKRYEKQEEKVNNIATYTEVTYMRKQNNIARIKCHMHLRNFEKLHAFLGLLMIAREFAPPFAEDRGSSSGSRDPLDYGRDQLDEYKRLKRTLWACGETESLANRQFWRKQYELQQQKMEDIEEYARERLAAEKERVTYYKIVELMTIRFANDLFRGEMQRVSGKRREPRDDVYT